MIHFSETSILIPTTLLLTAVVMDIKSGKFPNWMFMASLVGGLAWMTFQSGVEGAMKGFIIAIVLFFALSPLVFAKILGGGDIKLLAAFSLFTSWQITLSTLLYSLFWGALLGILRIVLAGEAKTFFTSMALRTHQVQSQKIPYTVAILLGWLTWTVQGGVV